MCSESSEINENFQKKRSCPAKLRGVLSLAVRNNVQSRDSNDSYLRARDLFLSEPYLLLLSASTNWELIIP